MKKSVKWTCKACGEKQSFLRAYGEGSGADCRRHVQKLNLLQGEVAEMSFRSPEAPVGASEEEGTGSLQAGARLQETRPPPESRWLKYLEDDCGQGLDGACSPRQPSPSTGKPGPAFHQNLPRKRKRGQSTPSARGHEAQDGGDAEVAWAPQAPPLPPGNSPHVDRERRPSPRGLQPASPALPEQSTPGAWGPREGHLSRPPAVQLPGAEGTPLVQGAPRPPSVRLCDLFTTGEDFDDDL
ncbi:MRN complex-interacting protein isoform X2 [Tupaia chinensis]|uniref:MRN complex-interacting protein isoform X2 n=1 Tax=Tupaia chinensis TaxID=246437 RepID=UPI000FFB1055|nr:MRN complex-interacting protein isoform X2 [Tupaia chinensis]